VERQKGGGRRSKNESGVNMKSTLTKDQKIKKVAYYTEDGTAYRITATIRHDDECGNGHNTFSITGRIDEKKKNGHWYDVAGGCIHEEIEKHFPELKPFIKWHLCSTDEPMHYIANTLYRASDRDCWGTRKGEPRQYELQIKFVSFPVTFKFSKSFIEWAEKQSQGSFKVCEVEHPKKVGETYEYKPKYTFHGIAGEWYQCPFDSKQEAEQFETAFNNIPFEVVSKATAWGEGKEPDLEGARYCAIWPEATLEQLQNKELLLARLPALMDSFKKDVESLGLTF
jgi:hypothetical protein